MCARKKLSLFWDCQAYLAFDSISAPHDVNICAGKSYIIRREKEESSF